MGASEAIMEDVLHDDKGRIFESEPARLLDHDDQGRS